MASRVTHRPTSTVEWPHAGRYSPEQTRLFAQGPKSTTLASCVFLRALPRETGLCPECEETARSWLAPPRFLTAGQLTLGRGRPRLKSPARDKCNSLPEAGSRADRRIV